MLKVSHRDSMQPAYLELNKNEEGKIIDQVNHQGDPNS